MIRRSALLLVPLLAAACNRSEPPASPAPPAPRQQVETAMPVEAEASGNEASAAPPPLVPAPGDAPLPATDEVPRFLLGLPPEPPPLPTEIELDESGADAILAEAEPGPDPTLQELMRKVKVEDGDASDESWAFIGGAEPLLHVAEEEPEPDEAEEESGEDAVELVLEAPAGEAEPEGDPCEPLRRVLARRQDYLRRTAAERHAYGYVQNEEDQQALRLLQGLRRCAEHPDDADCQQQPIERRLEELEAAPHTIERNPSDLNAEGKMPDEIPHDPLVLDLLHQLKACEKRTDPQPLLRSGGR